MYSESNMQNEIIGKPVWTHIITTETLWETSNVGHTI